MLLLYLQIFYNEQALLQFFLFLILIQHFSKSFISYLPVSLSRKYLKPQICKIYLKSGPVLFSMATSLIQGTAISFLGNSTTPWVHLLLQSVLHPSQIKRDLTQDICVSCQEVILVSGQLGRLQVERGRSILPTDGL